jgi:hypothetical protein
MTGHAAARPSWDCLACGKAWPCYPAREQLAGELDPVQLAMYLWGHLEEAAGDLPGMPASAAFDRFLAWTRHPQATNGGCIVSGLPPVDPERNRELIAERMGWPAEALEVCRRLEKDFPRWMVFWTSGGLPVTPEPGYRAILEQRRHTTKLYAPTAVAIEAKLAMTDPTIPPRP